MRAKTWFVPLLVIGVVTLATLGCDATDLIASLSANPQAHRLQKLHRCLLGY
jgi:hypothetical protein